MESIPNWVKDYGFEEEYFQIIKDREWFEQFKNEILKYEKGPWFAILNLNVVISKSNKNDLIKQIQQDYPKEKSIYVVNIDPQTKIDEITFNKNHGESTTYDINAILSTNLNDSQVTINSYICTGSSGSCISKKFMLQNKNDFRPILVNPNGQFLNVNGQKIDCPLFLFDVTINGKKNSIIAPIGTSVNCFGMNILKNYKMIFELDKFCIE